jgi:AcrR family transcriptional regulator
LEQPQRIQGEPAAVVATLEQLEHLEQPLLRRDGDRAMPAGPKAQRTRRRILDAARSLFSERGYHNTAVADIIERTGVSCGTFYQYFRDRSDVLGAIITERAVQLARQISQWRTARSTDDLEAMITAFVEMYTESVEVSGVWESACHVDKDAATLRRSLGRILTESVERELIRGSKAGRCRHFSPTEAALAARALAGMVDRFCYVTYVFDPPETGPPEPEEAASLLAQLWANAICLSG